MSTEDRVGPALRALEAALTSRAHETVAEVLSSRNRCATPAVTSSSRNLLRHAGAGVRRSAKIRAARVARDRQGASHRVRATSRSRSSPGLGCCANGSGTTHEVLVTDKGFVWDGTTYRSLSAIAFAITAAKWNGHRFFGLVKGRGGANG